MIEETGPEPVTQFDPPPEPPAADAASDGPVAAVSAGTDDRPAPFETPGPPEPLPSVPAAEADSVIPTASDDPTAVTGAEAHPRHAVEGVRVISVANQKGGVGKSTTAVNLGAALAELGQRVLVVDLDPQGNASTGMGIDHTQREVNSYGVLTAGVPAEDAIVDTQVPNLSAIPSTIDLAGAEIELVSQFSRETRLSRALDPIMAAYDFVILDCPPSLGLLTVNALTASTELIVPIQCEYYALEGLGQLLRNVRLVQQNVNPKLRLSGIVMTMFDSRTKLAEQVVEEVRRYFGKRVYDTIIPRTVRLSEAPGYGQPITVYDTASKGAECYRALAQEVLHRPVEDGMAAVPVGDEALPAVILPARTEEEPEGSEEEPEPEPEPQPEPEPEAGFAPADDSPEPEPEPEGQPEPEVQSNVTQFPESDAAPAGAPVEVEVEPGPQVESEGVDLETGTEDGPRRRGIFRRREGGQE